MISQQNILKHYKYLILKKGSTNVTNYKYKKYFWPIYASDATELYPQFLKTLNVVQLLNVHPSRN